MKIEDRIAEIKRQIEELKQWEEHDLANCRKAAETVKCYRQHREVLESVLRDLTGKMR